LDEYLNTNTYLVIVSGATKPTFRAPNLPRLHCIHQKFGSKAKKIAEDTVELLKVVTASYDALTKNLDEVSYSQETALSLASPTMT
jgi:hypothetical protein